MNDAFDNFLSKINITVIYSRFLSFLILNYILIAPFTKLNINTIIASTNRIQIVEIIFNTEFKKGAWRKATAVFSNFKTTLFKQ